jgi:ribonuclease HI
MGYYMSFKVDGACSNNGTPLARGATAAVRFHQNGHTSHRTRRLPNHEATDYNNVTSARAELTALIMALEWAVQGIAKLHSSPTVTVAIRGDSEYAVKSMRDWISGWMANGWKTADGGPVANRDLMERAWDLEQQVVKSRGEVRYIWIPRHRNKLADKLAKKVLE